MFSYSVQKVLRRKIKKQKNKSKSKTKKNFVTFLCTFFEFYASTIERRHIQFKLK